MAARSRTLQQLIDAVSDRADVVPAASGVRHTIAIVTDRINRSIQRWKLMVAEAGDDADMLTVRTTTNASAVRDANNWAPQQYLLQPAGLMLLRGIDIWETGTRPVAMLPADELERDDAFRLREWWSNGGTGMPAFYRLGGNAVAGGIIQIFPWADGTYTVDLRYTPAWVDVTNAATAIDFVLGGDEWVVNDAAIQTLIRDGQGGGAAAQSCRGWNQKLEQDMLFALARRSPVRKVDTRERRRELMWRASHSVGGGGGSSGGGGTLLHVYHGAALAVVTETDIKALAVDVLSTSRAVPNYAAMATGSNFEWFCLPASLGTPAFTDATTNFGVPFDNIATVSVTNSTGTAPYVVWRSHFAAIGTSGTIVIKVT